MWGPTPTRADYEGWHHREESPTNSTKSRTSQTNQEKEKEEEEEEEEEEDHNDLPNPSQTDTLRVFNLPWL